MAKYFNWWVKTHQSQDFGRFDAFIEGFEVGTVNKGANGVTIKQQLDFFLEKDFVEFFSSNRDITHRNELGWFIKNIYIINGRGMGVLWEKIEETKHEISNDHLCDPDLE